MKLFFLIIFLSISFFCKCQNDSLRVAKNAIYAEFGELTFSLYYDRILAQTGMNKISFRIGGSPIFLEKDIYPVEIGVQYMRGNKNNIGAGISVFYFNGLKGEEPQYGTSYIDTMAAGLFLAPRIIYRYQPSDHGVYFHVGGLAAFQIAELYKYKKHGLQMNYYKGLLLPTIGLGYIF